METDKRPYAERPNVFPWPPVIYAIALIAGWLIHLALPLPWLPGITAELLFALGVLLIAAALAIDFAAMRQMRRANTTVMPHRKSEHIVTSGVFSFSRNPIYLANTMIVIGVGLVSGIAWYLPLAIIAAYATWLMAISREERHLEARFGKAFRDYKKRVNRWF
ncbi:methyltransferase family protein [Oricola cellulosilytica]|uniref:Isoprenylcysteine carboxylmethyltransferase family protein n=1 Tax=Oricola cellulosilytica TaxID=1429082 RepID=A0A4R0P894_9HYPH|nr:isoprenylcysteine carboxylmethyltransferase family protein [Oricola cellulosilytica]TCD13241.1 isoprenylcysteine carboxylmethyltransferase family protein [Oricola cellulosilytica]